MKLSALKAPNRKKKAASASRSSGKAILVYALFCGALMVTLTSFISLELAGLTFGMLVMLVIGFSETARRRKWEKASDFKIMNIQKVQKSLTREVLNANEDIKFVKSSLDTLNARTQAIQKNAQYFSGFHGALQDYNPDLEPDKYIHPGLSSTLIANDDPFGEHASLSDMVVQELVASAIQKQRIDVFMQPIVRLPQRKAVAYELYARIRARAGLYVPAGRYIELARKQNISGEIDNLLLLKCLEMIKNDDKTDPNIPFFINIEPFSLKDRKFMRDLLSFVANNRSMARKLVFELRYSDYNILSKPVLSIMDAMAKLGCVFSLDHVNDLEFDLKTLLAQHIRYIKMRCDWVMSHNQSDSEFTHLWRAKQKLEANGIRVIASYVENEDILRELMDYDMHFGQGFLFGKPDTPGAFAPYAYSAAPAKRMGVQETFG